MYQRIVVKLGTSVLTGGTPRLDRAHMVEIARQCAALHQAGRDVILCTSGAITAGRERLGLPEMPTTLAGKQMLAAVGQSRLMRVWERLFDLYGIYVGQMLLTRAEWCQRAGDEEARRGHLREAWRLFQAMGADGALRRMKRDFGDLVD